MPQATTPRMLCGRSCATIEVYVRREDRSNNGAPFRVPCRQEIACSVLDLLAHGGLDNRNHCRKKEHDRDPVGRVEDRASIHHLSSFGSSSR